VNSVYSTLKSLHFEATTFCCEFVLFLLLHFALKEILYKPMLAARARRNGDIDVQLAEAERLAGEARHAQTEYETQRQKQRHEIQEANRDSLSAAAKEAEARVNAAQGRAAEILRLGEIEVKSVQRQLEGEFEGRVAKVAEAIVRRVVEASVSAGLQTKVLSRWKEA
jgi:F0F1-type ATP synthase membrane subunit b/b'